MTAEQDSAFRAGYNAGVNGPDLGNCHFYFFSTPEKTKAWEKGKALGDEAKTELMRCIKEGKVSDGNHA